MTSTPATLDDTPPTGDMIHPAMIQAARAIGAVAKNLKNIQSNYAARSIDDILDAVHGPLTEAGIVVVPRLMAIASETRTSRGGNNTYYVEVQMEYDFVAADGSKVTVAFPGTAMDSSDKASNKALSAAFKMALIQTFTIPVTGEDADRDTLETREPTQWEVLYWPDEESFVEWHQTFQARMKALADKDIAAAWKRWRETECVPWPIDYAARDAADKWCAENSLGPADESPFVDPPATDGIDVPDGDAPTTRQISETKPRASKAKAASKPPPPEDEGDVGFADQTDEGFSADGEKFSDGSNP